MIRFDDEGAFRDQKLIDWIEAQAIRVSVIAGEAAWQVGKHSRHLEVLKENMSLLSSELGQGVKAEELLSLSLAAKNEMHSIQGYSPNQWCFGQDKSRVQSFLQNGNHLPTASFRNNSETFEEGLHRATKARQTFLHADSKRRVLRAARGRARKTETFQPGQLVYFYRKGRNNTSRHEAGWHGPARVVAIEKQSQGDENLTQGSVIWIVHGVILYRCAPEQLRKVPSTVQGASDVLSENHSPLQDLHRAGNQANYRDISQDLAQEPSDSEIHDIEPSQTARGSNQVLPEPPPRRVTGKTSQHGGQRSGHHSPLDLPGQESGESSLDRNSGLGSREIHGDELRGARRRQGVGREVCGAELPSGLPEPGELREVADRTPQRQRQVPEPDHLCPPGSQQRQVQDAEQFWRRADAVRRDDREAREESNGRGRATSSRISDQDVRDLPGSGPEPSGACGAAGSGQSRAAASNLPEPVPEHGSSGEARRDEHASGGSRGRSDSTPVMRRDRSRTPSGRGDYVWSNWVDKQGRHNDDDGDDGAEVLSTCYEEDVGNALDLCDGDLGSRGSKSFDPSTLKLGQFGWPAPAATWEPVPEQGNLGKTRNLDAYFCEALENHQEVFEIAMDIQPRDVHQTKQGGQSHWVFNEKPKKRAEVQFRSLRDDEKLEFMKAMQSELGSYLEHEAVEIARRHNVSPQRILGMRWVLSWKTVTSEGSGEVIGRKPKARLIIKGFQDPDLLDLKRDSPTLSTQNRNLVLTFSAMNNWQSYVGDIKTAFLNGDKTEYDREIFAEPPEEVKQMLGLKPHELFRILKAVYGLLHAPRAWADKLAKELTNQGWTQSKLEPCVWRLYDSNQNLCGIIGIHVDDLLCCGTGSVFEQHVRKLRESFPFGSWRDLRKEAVTFCGCELRQNEDGSIDLNQERYAETIQEIPLTRERKEQPQAELTDPERRQFRAALGALSWRATQSAPWMSATVSYLQGCFKDAIIEDVLQVNKLIRTQRQYSQTYLHFSSRILNPVIVTFHDASWACRRDGTSQGGLLTMIADKSVLLGNAGEFSMVAWQSKKLPRICRSSTAAEVQTGGHAVDSHEFMKQIVLEWMNPFPIPVREMDTALASMPSVLVTDSKNLYDSVVRIESSGLQLEERRLALEVLSIRERVAQAGVLYKWVDSDQQLADALSKPYVHESLLLALQRRVVKLQFDEEFVSAKRKRAWRRRQTCAAQTGTSSRKASVERVSPV